MVTAPHPTPPHSDFVPPTPTSLPADMTVGEARAILAAHGLRSLPVLDAGRMVGLITVEALGGSGGPAPHPDRPVLEVMDWHLVQVAPTADEFLTLRAFERAAWEWMRSRGHHPEG